MTKDRLEEFVSNHRDEFDNIEPSMDLWKPISNTDNNIYKAENGPKRRSIYNSSLKWVTRIAAALIIFAGSYYFHDYRSNQQQLAVGNDQIKNSKLYNTLLEAEYYYTAQIGVEKQKLYSMTVGNSPIRMEIKNELVELDNEFQRLKEDLNDNADNEEIISAMIQNYRLKLNILQDMMIQLQEDNKEKNTSDETKSIHI